MGETNKVLNPIHIGNPVHTDEKLYTQQEMYDAIVNAFNAAREGLMGISCDDVFIVEMATYRYPVEYIEYVHSQILLNSK